MLHRSASLIENLVVYSENMRLNMDRTYGLYNSQRILLKLVDKGMSREAAYDLVQPRAMQAWKEQRGFKELIHADPEISKRLTRDEIDEAFDAEFHMRNVDLIFERVGLG